MSITSEQYVIICHISLLGTTDSYLSTLYFNYRSYDDEENTSLDVSATQDTAHL